MVAASTSGLWTGSIAFAILGVVACSLSVFYVGKHSKDRKAKTENRLLAILVCTMAAFCMWLQWICAYMHQMNPIISPEPETEG